MRGQTLVVHAADKVLAIALAVLVCAAEKAKREAEVPQAGAARRCNRKFAALAMLRMLPPVSLFIGDVVAAIDNTIAPLATAPQPVVAG